MTETIDMTPTWTAAAHVYCAALEAGTGKGQQMAREEIMRMARQYDAALDERKELIAALKGMIEMATHHAMEPEERRDILSNARAAIAKAKGN